MIKIHKNIKKYISLIIICSFFGNVFSASASLMLAESVSGADYLSSILDNPINSSDNDPSGITNKQQGPKVDVTFTADGIIKPGSKITAKAAPSFFNNTSGLSDLYYTWYLKRSVCELTDSDHPDGTKINKDGKIVFINEDNDSNKILECDEDRDRIITVNDWKITAARIIASGSFDSNDANYDNKIDGTISSYKANPSFKESDGWRKYFVEDNNGDIYTDNNEDTDDCYVQTPETGVIYELRKTQEIFDNSCPADYHRVCVADQQAECAIFNQQYSYEEAAAAASAIPPLPYDIKRNIIDPTLSQFNACAALPEEINNEASNGYCDVLDIKNFKSGVSCGDGKYSICMKNDGSDTPFVDENSKTTGVIVGSNDNSAMCKAVAKPYIYNDLIVDNIFKPNTDPIYPNQPNCSQMQTGLINGIKDKNDKVLKSGNSALAPKCSFEKGNNLCKHLFPRLPKDIKNDKGERAITGDGEFNLAEKSFWKLDPSKPATNESYKKDEEVLVGHGINTFQWLYSTGDQIGVVVEGNSVFPTEHANSSGYKKMWAFSKGECKRLKEIENSKSGKSFYVEGNGDMKVGFLTTDVDLNDCLEDNLLEPDVEGFSKMSMKLSAMPENPINDPNGKGDILNIIADSLNITNPDGLIYKWFVQKSKDGSNAPIDNTSWIDITNSLISGGSFTAIDREGLGKKSLSINLNIKDVEKDMNTGTYNGVFYLKIKVKAMGTAADGSQSAEGSITVRVKQQDNEMKIYPVTATDSGTLSFNKGLSGSSNELCSDDQGKIRCYVAKNEIVALEVTSPENNKLSNFVWKVNGTEVTCSGNISTSCEIKGNKMFIPILGNEGEAIDVIASATNQKNEQMEISRHFVIGASQLQILAQDPNATCSLQCLDSSSVCPKYLGHYNDLNGNQYPDCSTQVLETRQGNTVTLGTYGQTGFDWAVDGQIMTEYQDKDQIQLVINKNPGDSYNIGLATRVLPGSINQKNNIRKALYKNWGVSPEEVTEESQSANIQLNVLEGAGQNLASKEAKSLAASLITHLPEQLVFLFKIFLTSATLLVSMSLLFALMPEAAFREED